jgi:hypothetical protein
MSGGALTFPNLEVADKSGNPASALENFIPAGKPVTNITTLCILTKTK